MKNNFYAYIWSNRMTSSNGKMLKNYVSIHWHLPYTTSNEKFPLEYLIYLNLFKYHFWLLDMGLSKARPVKSCVSITKMRNIPKCFERKAKFLIPMQFIVSLLPKGANEIKVWFLCIVRIPDLDKIT